MKRKNKCSTLSIFQSVHCMKWKYSVKLLTHRLLFFYIKVKVQTTIFKEHFGKKRKEIFNERLSLAVYNKFKTRYLYLSLSLPLSLFETTLLSPSLNWAQSIQETEVRNYCASRLIWSRHLIYWVFEWIKWFDFVI